MGNVNYDSSLDFGDITAAGDFPHTLNLGKTDADRKKVDIQASADITGGPVTVTVKGSDTGTSLWVDVGVNTITLEALKSGKASVTVSPNSKKYLKVTAAGTFTGTLGAVLNTYIGK
jgi:hypothetical protein